MVQKARPDIRARFAAAFRTRDPSVLVALLHELRERHPELEINEQQALGVLYDEIRQDEVHRTAPKPRRKS
jgi:hypothetical protein